MPANDHAPEIKSEDCGGCVYAMSDGLITTSLARELENNVAWSGRLEHIEIPPLATRCENDRIIPPLRVGLESVT